MDILYLSHCVPNPPDKGEKIRAFHELNYLATKYRVHLACLARNQSEVASAYELSDRCASVYAAPLRSNFNIARAAIQFAFGACLTTSFYTSRGLRQHVLSLARRTPLVATVAYSSSIAPYAPPQIPLLLDMVDVDSEKWFDYARLRRPSLPYTVEARRLRKVEIYYSARAQCTFVSTQQELELLHSFTPEVVGKCMENGTDFDYFDPSSCPEIAGLRNRRFIVFVGAMDYYPNYDAVCWFATRIYAELRQHDEDLEFFVVGRNPPKRVLQLAACKGITITGTVADVRPYLKAALATVAPLRMARGVQNKVLEALAMGKKVFASTPVWKTFGAHPPAGLVHCSSERAFIDSILESRRAVPASDPNIRHEAQRRFTWRAGLAPLAAELQRCVSTASDVFPG